MGVALRHSLESELEVTGILPTFCDYVILAQNVACAASYLLITSL